MRRHVRCTQLLIGVLLLCATIARADDHEGDMFHMGGNFEGGFNWGNDTGGPDGTRFLVDAFHWHKTLHVSDKTKIVVNNAITVNSGLGRAPVTTFTALDAVNYLNTRAGLTVGTTFGLFNQEAYLNHMCSDNFHFAVGQFSNPFSMETMGERYDMHSYYYSYAQRISALYRWNYDVGVKLHMKNWFPGELELAIVDGRNNTLVAGTAPTDTTPATVARYHLDLDMGDMVITPVASTYLGRWSGGPDDVGISAGLKWKMGMIWANAEWLYVSSKGGRSLAGTGTRVKDSSIIIEPGVMLGDIGVSAKLDITRNKFGATSTNDLNLGAAISKTYDKYRIRLTFLQTNLSKKQALPVRAGSSLTDVRLLFGANW